MIILGVDPGLATTGYGVIEKAEPRSELRSTTGEGGNLSLLDYGIISTPAKTEFSFRLKLIGDDLKKIINKYKPEAAAVEKIFFAKNTKTALDVGQARGVILLKIMEADIPVYEFTPLQVKQAVSGYGGADKKQIQKMVQIILKLKELPEPDDAADALAISIALANSINLINIKK